VGKRSTIYELIDENIETPYIKDQIKDYISNLLKKNSELEQTIQRRNSAINKNKRKKVEKWLKVK
jgi:hypothetical protein